MLESEPHYGDRPTFQGLSVRCIAPAREAKSLTDGEYIPDFVGHADSQQLEDAVLQKRYQAYIANYRYHGHDWDQMTLVEGYLRWLTQFGYVLFNSSEPGVFLLRMGQPWD